MPTPPSSPPTLRKIEHLLCSVFLLFVDEGLHNYVVCNCVAVKPLRAGAHSLVQARSFHYYGTLCLRPPSSPPLKDKQIQTACFFIYDGNSLRGGRTRALRKQWTPIVFSDDRSALCGTHLYKHFCRTKRKNDPLSFFDEGLHNYVVCNCVAVKPLRAGAHSHVQAHSFHYYGTLCLRPPSSPP